MPKKKKKDPLYPEAQPFTDVTAIKEYYDKLLPQLSKYGHTRAPEYVELLVENCLAEKQFDAAMGYFLRYVRSEGLEIDTDQKYVRKAMEKLFELRFLRALIHASGLGLLEEQILSHEVDRMYGGGNKDMAAFKALLGALQKRKRNE
jgi:hypothetical protein